MYYYATYGLPMICPSLVVELRSSLKRTNLFQQLQYADLVKFVVIAHDKDARTGLPTEYMDTVVKETLEELRRAAFLRDIATPTTASKIGLATSPDIQTFLLAMVNQLKAMINFLEREKNYLSEQHGGLTHQTMDEIMFRIGNIVDRTALMMAVEELAAVHAHQLTNTYSCGVNELRMCLSLLERFMAAIAWQVH